MLPQTCQECAWILSFHRHGQLWGTYVLATTFPWPHALKSFPLGIYKRCCVRTFNTSRHTRV
jgi:hypothetical protein